MFGSVRKTGCSVRFGRLGARFGSEEPTAGEVFSTCANRLVCCDVTV